MASADDSPSASDSRPSPPSPKSDPSADTDRRAGGGSTTPSGLLVTLRSIWRFLVVCYRFLPLVGAYARDRRRFVVAGGRREVTPTTRRRRARYLLDSFVDLGPAFIKFGQILSTRPDVLPGAYVDVLSELQDTVPPDDWADVRGVVEAELGPVEERFDAFDTDPISGASLGQVYVASVGSDRVAVKVLRPGVRARVEADLRVITTLLPWVVRFAPPGQAFTMENLADEFAATIREEMHYGHERAMLREIGANFADDPRIRIPDPLDSHSTDRVLTMEYVEGVKIDDVDALDARGIDRAELARYLEDVYIQMIVEDGVFHADPHPGNLAVQDDGTVVFYDFGMTGRIDAHTREHLFEFYVALANDDLDAVIDAFVAMDALDPTADRELMREVFAIAIEEFRGAGIDQYRIQEFVTRFGSDLYEFPMRLPRNMALVVRVSTVLEGVCRTLEPEFDFVDGIKEYVADRTREEAADVEQVAEYALQFARPLLGGLVRVPPKLDRALARAERDDLDVRVTLEDDGGEFGRLARRLVFGLLFGVNVVLVSSLYAIATPTEAALAAVGLPLFGALLYRSFRSRRGVRARPQFTRQQMRQRDRDEEQT